MFDSVTVIGATGRSGSAICARLRQHGVRLLEHDGELIVLCVPDRVISEVARRIDPGPWMCSGMTGGVVYIRLQPEMGMDMAALGRRKATAAVVAIVDKLDATDEANIAEMLSGYADALDEGNQPDEAREVRELAAAPHGQFAKVIARNQQVDPSVSTE